MAETVIATNVQGKDIDQFITEKLLPVVDGVRLDLVAAAMLTVLVASMDPDMGMEDLGAAVTDIAAYIVTRISNTTNTEVVN